MKKFKYLLFLLIGIFLVFQLILFNSNNSYCYNEMVTLEFETVNESEIFDLYILLPKEYIEYVIKNDKLDIEYKGVETLKDNDIPSINVNKENISNDLYKENDKEYIQILLEENENNKYEFDILKDYGKLNIKYRIKNINRDEIVHIDNFKIDSNNVCEIKYNYEENTVKQPNVGFIPFITKLLIVILVITIIVGIIAYVKKRR